MKKLPLLFLLVLLFFSQNPSGLAQSPQEAGLELNRRLTEILRQQEKISASQIKLREELAQSENEIKKVDNNLQSLWEQEQTISRQLPAVQNKIGQISPQVEEQTKRYYSRLRLLYLLGPEVAPWMLASDQSYQQVLTRSQLLSKLLDLSKQQLADLRQQRRELNTLRSTLAFRQNELQEISNRVHQEHEHLLALRRERRNMVDQLAQRQKELEENRLILVEAEARLNRTFASIRPQSQLPTASTGILQAKGSLWPPVEGKLMPSALPDKQGIYLSANPGAPVRSPWAGSVVHAAPLAGYGQVVIVDHGDRVHTVLSQLAVVSVETGQRLQTGQIIGMLNQDGVLYLELRQGAKVQDPKAWLKTGS